jgi:dolichyl-phosphate-mannose-protein mannosyltransferase
VEEKIEYRDEEGRLLDPEQVKALEGKVSFSTRYETRTRLVDAQGNEIYNEVVEEGAEAPSGRSHGVKGTQADAPEPGTGKDAGVGQESTPSAQAVEEDLRKEKWVEEAKATPEPESEVGKATGKDEL